MPGATCRIRPGRHRLPAHLSPPSRAISGHGLPFIAIRAADVYGSLQVGGHQLTVTIVTQELGLPVTLLPPTAQPAGSLVRVAGSVRHIEPYIGRCQLPDPVAIPGKKPIAKPARW